MTAETVKDFDLTPPDNYDDLQIWLARNFTILQPEVAHLVGETGEPAFENDWQNYTPIPDFFDAGFYKDAFGRVHLQGLVETTTGTGFDTNIFTLPSEYRPINRVMFVSVCTLDVVARIDVFQSGIIRLKAGDGSVFLSLDGLSFKPGI